MYGRCVGRHPNQNSSQLLPVSHRRSSMAICFTDAVVAQRYALFRPNYPDSLLGGILSYVTRMRTNVEQKAIENLDVVDVGCGAGQSTFFLAKAGFRKIHGIDTSRAQINEATKALARRSSSVQRQVDFQVADADNGWPLAAGSADVVTVAQALHWLDHSKFYAHVDRGLRPGGYFLALGYGNCQILDDGVSKLLTEFYSEKMGEYWAPEREHIDTLYSNMPMPYSPLERLSLELQYKVTLSNLIGYVSSWSAYATYCEQHPGNTALEDLRLQFIQAIKSSPSLMSSQANRECTDGNANIGDVELEIKFPIFALMSQKPNS